MITAQIVETGTEWETVTLGEVCQINPGKPKADALPADAPVSFVPMSAVDEITGAIAAPEVREYMKVRGSYTAFQDRDVLFAKITPCMENGKAAIARDLVNGLGFGSSEFHVLRSNDKVLPEFVYQLIRQKSFRAEARDNMTGSVGQARVPTEWLKNFEFELPPIEIQREIVLLVSHVQKQMESTSDRLATIPALLKKFRQSVLAAACSGQLTADWREENRQYSSNGLILDLKSKWSSSRERQLAAAITQDVTELPGLPDTWEYLECRKLTDPSRSLTYGVIKLGEQDDDGVPCLRSSDVRRLHINESKVKKISREIERGFKRTSLIGGEVVVTVRGTLGGVAVVPLHMRGFNVSREVAVIPIADPINPSFVALAIASEPQSKWLVEVAKGVAYTGINIEDLCRLPIPVPPIEEQAEIVRRVESLFALADSIESRLAEATAQVERTTQAILAKAFRGELTAEVAP
jgi:type I restriction enzyme S subunit